MDPPPPPPPSSAGPPDDHDDRVSGTHRWNVSLAPDTPCSFFLCSFHLGATTTTITTTTIVTTPRRQAIAGKWFIFFTHGNRLGRDVNLSPPGLVEDKPGQVSPSLLENHNFE